MQNRWKTLSKGALNGIALGSLFSVILGTAAPATATCLPTAIQLTAYKQDLNEAAISPTLIKSTTIKLRVTTQDILNVLATHYDQTFPLGARLCFEGTGVEATVRNSKDDGVLYSIETSAFALVLDPNPVYSMTANLAGGSVTSTYFSTASMSIHSLPAMDFTVAGMVVLKTAWKTPGTMSKDSISINVAGRGTLLESAEDPVAILSGKISLKGLQPLL